MARDDSHLANDGLAGILARRCERSIRLAGHKARDASRAPCRTSHIVDF